MTKTRIITHNGGFHADDVFGVATLILALGEEDVEVIRTRDPEIISSAEYVLDVGGLDDPDHNRFDHHQQGGAGKRENGIPYASFGLIWKRFGADLCGSQEAADDIDRRLVQPIDAHDNGITISKSLFEGLSPYTMYNALFSFKAGVSNEEGFYAAFMEAVAWVMILLRKEVALSQERMAAFKYVADVYTSSEDKAVIVFDPDPKISREMLTEAFQTYSDVIYFIRPHELGIWQVVCAVDDVCVYKNRKDLPENWAGKRDEELAAVTGVSDAVFCHSKRFMAVAKSKEGAVALAKLALEA